MKILSVEHIVPSTKLTNEETIARMVHASKPHLSRAELEIAENQVQFLFAMAGAETRYVADANERPLDLTVSVAEQALGNAGVSAKELDFILFCGVTRRFLVPSSAAVIQDALGAQNSTCFDVLDACASWARALEIADKFLTGKSTGVGLIVGGEIGCADLSSAWEIKSADKIKSLVGALTLGEAASATVVGASQEEQFRFHSKTYGQHSQLAVWPIVDIPADKAFNLETLDALKFHTQMNELTKHGLKMAIKSAQEADFFRDGPTDYFIPHAGAEASVEAFLKITNIPAGELVMSFRNYGNTVTASIPLGLSLATKDRRIKRGDRIFVATAAAGISTVGAIFQY